jgi:hypothetical protein
VSIKSTSNPCLIAIAVYVTAHIYLPLEIQRRSAPAAESKPGIYPGADSGRIGIPWTS